MSVCVVIVGSLFDHAISGVIGIAIFASALCLLWFVTPEKRLRRRENRERLRQRNDFWGYE